MRSGGPPTPSEKWKKSNFALQWQIVLRYLNPIRLLPLSRFGGSTGAMAVTAPKPSEFFAVVVQPTDTLAAAFVKVFIRFPVLLLRFWSAIYQADGTFTPEFRSKLCAVFEDCPEETP